MYDNIYIPCTAVICSVNKIIHITIFSPSNTGNSPNAISMLAHRLRRWPNIETALGKCPVCAGSFPLVVK